MTRNISLLGARLCVLLLLASAAHAQQENKKDDMQSMPGMGDMQMPGMNMGGSAPMTMHPETFVQQILAQSGSGTSAEPNSTPTPMLMMARGKWSLMFHANVFVLDEQQSSAPS